MLSRSSPCRVQLGRVCSTSKEHLHEHHISLLHCPVQWIATLAASPPWMLDAGEALCQQKLVDDKPLVYSAPPIPPIARTASRSLGARRDRLLGRHNHRIFAQAPPNTRMACRSKGRLLKS